jgi:hypothetical protein
LEGGLTPARSMLVGGGLPGPADQPATLEPSNRRHDRRQQGARRLALRLAMRRASMARSKRRR